MIVLDTNIFRSLRPPEGAGLAVVRTLATKLGHEVAIPEMVLREYLAWRRRDVAKKVLAVESGVRDVLALGVHWDGRDAWERVAKGPDLDSVVQVADGSLRDQFKILELEGDVAREALFREAARRRPAKTDESGKGAGARYVAIWLTVLGCCSAEPSSTVYFVALDNDFGKGSLHAELIAEAPQNLQYCNGLDQLLEALARPSKRKKAEAIAVLRCDNVQTAVSGLLNEVEYMAEMAIPIMERSSFASGVTGPLSSRTKLTVTGVDEARVRAYESGDDTTLIVGDIDWSAEVAFVDIRDGWSFKPLLVAVGQFAFRTTVVVAERSNGALESVSIAHVGPMRLESMTSTLE